MNFEKAREILDMTPTINHRNFVNANPNNFPKELGYYEATLWILPIEIQSHTTFSGTEVDVGIDHGSRKNIKIVGCDTTSEKYRKKIFEFIQNVFDGEKVVIEASVSGHKKASFPPPLYKNSDGITYEEMREKGLDIGDSQQIF